MRIRSLLLLYMVLYKCHKIGGISICGVLSGWLSELRERPGVDPSFVSAWLGTQDMVGACVGYAEVLSWSG